MAIFTEPTKWFANFLKRICHFGNCISYLYCWHGLWDDTRKSLVTASYGQNSAHGVATGTTEYATVQLQAGKLDVR